MLPMDCEAKTELIEFDLISEYIFNWFQVQLYSDWKVIALETRGIEESVLYESIYRAKELYISKNLRHRKVISRKLFQPQ